MAFPQVAAVNGGITAGTSHTVNLPADIAEGDLLLVFFVAVYWLSAPSITFPEGWTQLFQTPYGASITFGGWYRIADGAEGATITVTTSSTDKAGHTSYRITGYSGTPESGTAATGNTATPNPPNLTPSWGAKDTLWFVCAGTKSGSKQALIGCPTNYTNCRIEFVGTGCCLGSSRRELNAASEDPGTFSMSYSQYWIANTVAIQPAVPVVAKAYGLVV